VSSGAFPSWDRSIWTAISLRPACSCHEILRMEPPRQDAYFFAGDFRAVLDSFTQLVGRPRRKLSLSVRAEVTEIPLRFHRLQLRFLFGCIRTQVGRPFLVPIYGLGLGDSDCYHNKRHGDSTRVVIAVADKCHLRSIMITIRTTPDGLRFSYVLQWRCWRSRD
jgi:alpha-glucosidase (family GH31 glycosyl hydrolase)